MLRTHFTPLNLANLDGWWDAADSASVTTVSSVVSQWNDKSGNGRDMSQSNSNNRPAYSNQLNGLNVMTFDGLNDSLNISGTYAATQYTTFAVAKPGSTSTTCGIFTADPGSGSGRGPQYMRWSNTTYQAVGFDSGTPKVESPSTAAAVGTRHVISVVQNATALEMWINNSSNGSTACAQSAYTRTLYIGVASVGANFLNGDIAEVIVYGRALTTAEREMVQRYLANKWGITL